MPSEITHKTQFRLGPIAVALVIAFIVGYLLALKAYGLTPPPRGQCPQPAALVQPYPTESAGGVA